MDDVTVMIDRWWDYPIIWVCLIVAILLMLLLVSIRLKLSSMSKDSKQSFRDLSAKIDSIARTNDAFSELNAKIDNMNRTASELQNPYLKSEV